MLNDNASVVPANTLSDILVHLGEFGLEVRQQSVQQFRDSPLLLGQPPLKHIQQAARDKHISDEDGGGGSLCYCSMHAQHMSARVTTAALT